MNKEPAYHVYTCVATFGIHVRELFECQKLLHLLVGKGCHYQQVVWFYI